MLVARAAAISSAPAPALGRRIWRAGNALPQCYRSTERAEALGLIGLPEPNRSGCSRLDVRIVLRPGCVHRTSPTRCLEALTSRFGLGLHLDPEKGISHLDGLSSQTPLMP